MKKIIEMNNSNYIETTDGVFHEIETINELQREIYLTGELTHDMSIEIANQIREVNRFDLKRRQSDSEYIPAPINIYINTLGGAVFAGIEIITAIRQSKTVVNGIVTGTCYSMGVTIFVACHNRLISPFAQFMSHSISVEALVGRSVLDYSQQLEMLSMTQDIIKDIMSEYLGDENHPLIQILDEDKDHYFNAQTAIEYGIVDEYVENVDIEFLLGVGKILPRHSIADDRVKNSRKWKAKIK